MNAVMNPQNLAAKAAMGRVAAINAAKDLHWVVEAGEIELTFDEAPTMIEVVEAAQAKGSQGLVLIRSVTVRPKKQRRLLLSPLQRVRSFAMAAAAE